MCDVCDFVRQHARQHDDLQLDAVLDRLLEDELVELDELYFELALACGGVNVVDMTGGVPHDEAVELSCAQLDTFVRLVQMVWEEHGDSTAAAFQRGYVTGQQDLLARQNAAGSLAVH